MIDTWARGVKVLIHQPSDHPSCRSKYIAWKHSRYECGSVQYILSINIGSERVVISAISLGAQFASYIFKCQPIHAKNINLTFSLFNDHWIIWIYFRWPSSTNRNGSDNGMAPTPNRCHVITWIQAKSLTNICKLLKIKFSWISIKFQHFRCGENEFQMSPAKPRPFCLGLNMLSYRHSNLISSC